MQYLSKEGSICSNPATKAVASDYDDDLLTQMLAVAESAAFEAGSLQMRNFGNASLVLDRADHDLKIETDRASEAVICRAILDRFPQHAILSEECGSKGSSEYTWIIDPLDGTVNYYYGIPFFCTCVACYRTPASIDACANVHHRSLFQEAEPLIGVVYAPYFDWMFSAVSAQGATFNGQSLQIPTVPNLEESILGISFGSHNRVIQQMEALNAKLLRKAKKIRMLGATGFDLTLVAKGTLSGLVQLNVSIWDFAAARLILTESNVDFEARPNDLGGWQILAAPCPLFDQLKPIIDSSLAETFILSD